MIPCTRLEGEARSGAAGVGLRRDLGDPAFDEATRDTPDAVDVTEQTLTGPLRRRFSGPAVDRGSIAGGAREPGSGHGAPGSRTHRLRRWSGRDARSPVSGPGHLEVANLAFDRGHHGLRIDLERCRSQVSVEEVVQVLIGRDSSHDLSSRGVGQEPARVVVRDARGELLQRIVRERVGDTCWFGTTPVETWVMRARSSATRSTAGDSQVVTDHDRVTTLFRSPASDPRTPGVVGAESPQMVQ